MQNSIQKKDPITKKWYRKVLSHWLVSEFLTINKLALPCAITSFGSQMLPIMSLFFTGHIGNGLYLDGAALALSFSNITCKSVAVGFSSGMDTLCSQAYGAKKYRLMGVYFQRAVIISLVSCLPILALSLNAESILIMIHQDPDVAAVAGKYLRILAIANPGIIIYFLSRKFMQAQRVVYPCIVLNVLGNAVNISCHYLLIIRLKLGVEGAAISLSIGYWSLAIFYMMYIRCSSLYRVSWPGWGIDALNGWLHYCKYGVPGLIMLCLEWWTFEIGFLIVGATSGDPKVQVGIFSIMLNVSVQIFTIPVGYTIAANVRVGNLLGENNPSLARKVSYLSLFLIFLFGMHFSVGVFLLKSKLPQLFTKDKCIIAGASSTLIITAIYQNFDGLKLMAGGIIKGCGRQKIGSITNFLVYQFFAMPLAIFLCVVLKMSTKGYWIGMASAIFLQAVIFLALVICTNWRKVADKAQENVGNKPTTWIQNSNQDSDSTALLKTAPKSYAQGKRQHMISHGNLIKIAIVIVLIASFVIGLGFSFNSSRLITPLEQFQTNKVVMNSTELSCQY